MERIEESTIDLSGLESLIINPRGGTITIRRRVSGYQPTPETETQLNTWWDENSMSTVLDNHIGLWFRRKANESAVAQGMSVNDVSNEMDFVRTEQQLRDALLSAKGMHLKAFDVTQRVKSEVTTQVFLRGFRIRWQGEYMKAFLEDLKESWGLSKAMRKALETSFVKH